MIGSRMEDDEEEGPPIAIQIQQEESTSHYSDSDSKASVGVTVITGYLGAGKSTVSFPRRISVPLSATPISSFALLKTTGLANPAPLASVLWLDEQLESAVKLDSIITVVDAKNLRFQLAEHRGSSSSFPEAYFQIAFADIIILNKVDLVSPEGSGSILEELEEEIHNINSLAETIHSVRCQVDLSKILNRQAYDSAHASHLEKLLEESRSLSSKKLHDSSVRTICICQSHKVDLEKVRIWLEEILWEKKYDMDVYRCKGVLSIQNSDQLHTLQGVRELYDIVPTRQWEKEENRTNKIVFIGHNLKEDVLIDSFRTCTTC
ncbi:uncharacterized protein LOC129323168 isoform X2 [Prosopis cineraria]|uniref:uncharacterized protein LOC129323168 isoform X2 n=1 Tax=Prosopis cineraria TaxID=364024 RepID=UPI00241069AF|nr:uncharacterized protein LOC129323168 isoform X2 [Prosopis cineraria]